MRALDRAAMASALRRRIRIRAPCSCSCGSPSRRQVSGFLIPAMAVDALQHINLRSADVDRSRDFYVDVIGLYVGPRPPITSVGYWLYLGPVPVIHLVQR